MHKRKKVNQCSLFQKRKTLNFTAFIPKRKISVHVFVQEAMEFIPKFHTFHKSIFISQTSNRNFIRKISVHLFIHEDRIAVTSSSLKSEILSDRSLSIPIQIDLRLKLNLFSRRKVHLLICKSI